jgi:hypothetical protein
VLCTAEANISNLIKHGTKEKNYKNREFLTNVSAFIAELLMEKYYIIADGISLEGKLQILFLTLQE